MRNKLEQRRQLRAVINEGRSDARVEVKKARKANVKRLSAAKHKGKTPTAWWRD